MTEAADDAFFVAKYMTDLLGSSFALALFGQSPEERGREIVRSIDKLVAPYGGSAEFDRVEGVRLHYTLSVPSAVAELWRTSAVAMGVY
jgi:hypothetical protein